MTKDNDTTFEKIFRKRFGRAPTPDEIRIIIDQSVTSYNQSGGITAGTVNFGKPHRTLNSLEGIKLKAQILRELDRSGPWSVAGIVGDMESCQYANEIRAFMESEGFVMAKDGSVAVVPMEPVIGVEVWPPNPKSQLDILQNDWQFIVGAKP